MRQTHAAGERLFVDYAGDGVPVVVDRLTGEIRMAQIFVAVLGASSFTFAHASWTQALPDWIDAHVRALAAIAITSAIRPSVPVLILLMVLAGWAGAARVVRAIALQERGKDYVKAAAVIGASPLRIAMFHVFPSVVPSLAVLAAMQMAAMIVFEETLSFLGMGVQPPTPSWGGIMLDGKNYMTSSWWLTLFPGLAIVVTSLSLVLIGDGLQARRDRLRSREGDA